MEAIKKVSSAADWNYVPTEINPADLGTRPQTPEHLRDSAWINGPEFLHTSRELPKFAYQPCSVLPEAAASPRRMCRTAATEVQAGGLTNLAKRLSGWGRIIHVVQRVMQMGRKWLDKARQSLGVQLAVRGEVEFQTAENLLFGLAQRESFPEIFTKEKGEQGLVDQLPLDHPLSGVVPYVGEEGLVRVGGRLREAALSFEVKHPVVLHGQHMVTRRYVEAVHDQTPHQGRVLTLSMVRGTGVFVLGGRRLIDAVIKQCVTCAKLRGKTEGQLMADLPSARLEATAPFTEVGADVFGPFVVEEGQTTRARTSKVKVFVLLLTCLASRAVHLEPLSGMDTTSMVNALKRFMAIRGKCNQILSDHGTNFIGALGQVEDFQRLQEAAKAEGIQWKLNPVAASHFGGVFERKIGSVRRVLEASLRKHVGRLTRDDLCTLLQEAGAVVNSTPLYADTDNVQEPLPISPSMLLTLRTPSDVGSYGVFSDRDVMAYGQRRWRRAQYLADEFWKLWRSNYLQELTSRAKWTRAKSSLRKGDLVLMREKNVPRCDWRMARVVEATEGVDGLVRRVKVSFLNSKGKIRDSERAIHDMVLLFRPVTSARECHA